jgi:hypothetical protein
MYQFPAYIWGDATFTREETTLFPGASGGKELRKPAFSRPNPGPVLNPTSIISQLSFPLSILTPTHNLCCLQDLLDLVLLESWAVSRNLHSSSNKHQCQLYSGQVAGWLLLVRS